MGSSKGNGQSIRRLNSNSGSSSHWLRKKVFNPYEPWISHLKYGNKTVSYGFWKYEKRLHMQSYFESSTAIQIPNIIWNNHYFEISMLD